MIIRNIFVVLVIYDYFSVVVCQCQLHQISVPSCPRSPHEWSLKAREICTMKDKYHCLITENHNEDIPDLIECCMPYKNISKGHMPRYNTLKKTIQEIACDHGYYMTTTFASNRYRLNGVEHCHYKKSGCVMEGMKIYDNGSTTEDRKCYCDYKSNFKPDLSLDPNVVYFYEKDNDCSMSECDLKFQEMNMMYQCVNVCKDGEYRPERSMDCIPKSSTTIPSVVVSTNGSTAGVVIKTTLQTTTKSTRENTIERIETTDGYLHIVVVVVVGVTAVLALAVVTIICVVILKKCKDGNRIICCVYDRKKFNIKAHTIVIGSGNELQENDSPPKPEEVPLIVVAPGQPRNIKVNMLSPNRIKVSWQPPTDSASITSYNIYFNDSSVMEDQDNNHVLEGLIPDTVYHIQVSAITNGREGEKSPMTEVKTSPLDLEEINKTGDLEEHLPEDLHGAIVEKYKSEPKIPKDLLDDKMFLSKLLQECGKNTEGLNLDFSGGIDVVYFPATLLVVVMEDRPETKIVEEVVNDMLTTLTSQSPSTVVIVYHRSIKTAMTQASEKKCKEQTDILEGFSEKHKFYYDDSSHSMYKSRQ